MINSHDMKHNIEKGIKRSHDNLYHGSPLNHSGQHPTFDLWPRLSLLISNSGQHYKRVHTKSL